MAATPPTPTSNAQRRALVLAHVEAKLKDIWPDKVPEGRRTFADFDALEAAATRTGDSLAQTLMEEGLREALQASGEDRPDHCARCGRKLQWSQKAHGVQTIRGPVRVEREYGYCRACERGFFPLGRALSAGGGAAERAAAAGIERTGQRR
jgi:hypothetical protein